MSRTVAEIYDGMRARSAAAKAAKAVEDAEAAVIPPPSVSARRPTVEEAKSCQSFHRAGKAAAKAGCQVLPTFSTGPYIGADASVLAHDVDSLALKITRPDGATLSAMWCRRRSGAAAGEWQLDFCRVRDEEGSRKLPGNKIGAWTRANAIPNELAA